jgi:AcrR family transcriptional regulator
VRAPRGEAARQRIITATRELLLDHGLTAFNVEAVAVASGSARSTIYRHWPDARDLLVEALTSMGREFPTPDTGSLRDDLIACAQLLKPVLDDRRTRRLFLDVTRAAIEDPEVERIRHQLRQDRHHPMRVILQRAIARGEVDPAVDMDLAIHLIEGPWLSATVLQDMPLTDQDIDALVGMIRKALA